MRRLWIENKRILLNKTEIYVQEKVLRLGENTYKLKENNVGDFFESSKNFEETLKVIFIEKLPEYSIVGNYWETLLKLIILVSLILISIVVGTLIISNLILFFWSLIQRIISYLRSLKKQDKAKNIGLISGLMPMIDNNEGMIIIVAGIGVVSGTVFLINYFWSSPKATVVVEVVKNIDEIAVDKIVTQMPEDISLTSWIWQHSYLFWGTLSLWSLCLAVSYIIYTKYINVNYQIKPTEVIPALGIHVIAGTYTVGYIHRAFKQQNFLDDFEKKSKNNSKIKIQKEDL